MGIKRVFPLAVRICTKVSYWELFLNQEHLVSYKQIHSMMFVLVFFQVVPAELFELFV